MADFVVRLVLYVYLLIKSSYLGHFMSETWNDGFVKSSSHLFFWSMRVVYVFYNEHSFHSYFSWLLMNRYSRERVYLLLDYRFVSVDSKGSEN